MTRLIVLLMLCASASTVFGAVPGTPAVPPSPKSLVLVRFKPEAMDSARQRYTILRERPRFGMCTLAVPAGETVDSLLARLEQDPDVVYAERNGSTHLLTLVPPNEPTWGALDPRPDYTTRMLEIDVPEGNQLPYTWAQETVGALEAWSIFPGAYYTAATKPADSVIVAVLDTGIDPEHEDFTNPGGTGMYTDEGGQVIREHAVSFSFRNDQGGPTPITDDIVGHGTWTSGIVGAAVNNGGQPGAASMGLAWPLRLMPIQVLNDAQEGSTEDLIDGILYAVDNGAHVLSISLGDYVYSIPLQEAVDYAWERGALVVAAAGNDGDSATGGQNRATYPAANNHALAVAATDPYDGRASYSNYGEYVGISAPGGDAVDAGVVIDLFGMDYPMPTQFGVWGAFPTHPYQLQLASDGMGGYVDDALNLNYDYAPGTSGACPFVAALAGLYMQKNNLPRTKENAVRVWQAIQRGSDQVTTVANGGWNQMLGFGRINAPATLQDQNTRSATVGCIVGRLTSNGVPVALAPVRAVGPVTKTGTTRNDGSYRISNLVAGTYAVTGNTISSTGTITVTVVPGADVPGVDFALPWPFGDTDASGQVTLRDAALALRMFAGVDPVDTPSKNRADIYPWIGTGGRAHGDGDLTIDDAGLILKVAAGMM